MRSQLEVLGSKVLEADTNHKLAVQKLLDATDEMRETMRKEGQYWVVVDGRLLRWRDGTIEVE